MIKPLFFINSVTVLKPKNKLQEYFINELGDIAHQSLDDASTLLRFERYLTSLIKKANALFPRSKSLTVFKSRDKDYYIQVPNAHGEASDVVIIYISTHKGPWKGGKL